MNYLYGTAYNMTRNSKKMNHLSPRGHMEEFIQQQNSEVVERINSRRRQPGF